LNLAEFRTHAYRLADWLPWACLIAPGVILNKDGASSAPSAIAAPISSTQDQPKRVRLLIEKIGEAFSS
jgi:hypothetical protein